MVDNRAYFMQNYCLQWNIKKKSEDTASSNNWALQGHLC